MKPFTPHADEAVNNNTFARSWAGQHRPWLQRNGGFTITEQLVVIAVIALLMGIAIPSYGPIINKVNQIRSRNRLTQIGIALGLYAEDNGGRFPEVTDPNQTPQQIREKLLPYVSNEEIFNCPVSKKPFDFLVTNNPKTSLSNVRLDQISRPSRLILGGQILGGKILGGGSSARTLKDKMLYVINGAFEVEQISVQEWIRRIAESHS
ncbi:type II secretion system protein [Planctomycetota bacterium]